MKVRRATYGDIQRILEVCEEAKSIMRSDGNMLQWTGGYPSEDVIRNDIDKGYAHVIECADGIAGYFAFIQGIEETYLHIEGGQWLDDSLPYATIHRLASTTGSHNVAERCFSYCWERIRNLRIDTHRDNRIMRHCIEKAGFRYCGIIYLKSGDERLAFQKI